MDFNYLKNKSLVFNDGNQEEVTDTFSVAVVFGKKHQNVLRDVDNLNSRIKSANASNEYKHLFDDVLFVEFSKPTKQKGHRTRDVLMNKIAFYHLVSTYTGGQALFLKGLYFKQFDELKRENERMKKRPLNMLEERDRQTLLDDNDDLHRNLYKKNKDIHMLSNHLDDARDKTYYYDKEMNTQSLFTIGKIAADYGTSAVKFDKAMMQAHIFYKKGYDYYVYAKYLDMNMVVYRTQDGGNNSSIHFTEKGRRTLFTILKNRFKVTPLGMRGMNFNSFYPFNHSFGEKCSQLTLNANDKNEV